MVKILRLAAVLSWICMPFFYAHAQGGYIEEAVWSNVNPASGLESDFIILSNGTKQFGEIVRNYNYTEYEKVDFEFNGGINTYYPADLKAFGLVNGRFFMSKMLSESSELEFVQVLLSGRLQLDYKKGKYYLDNGIEIQQLRSYYQDITGLGSSKKRHVKLYISTLKINTAGTCGMELTDLIERSRIDEQDFIRILTQYHECEDLPYKLHVVKIPFVQISPTLAVGLGSDFTKGSLLPDSWNYIFATSLSYRAFAGFRLHDFRRFPKSSLDLRLGYIYRSTVFESSHSATVGVITASQEFTEMSVVLPFSYSYSFIKRREIESYFGLVGAVWFNSMKDDLSIIDHNYLLDDNEVALIENSFLSASNYAIVPGIKVGGNFPIHKMRLFAEVQADYLADYYSVGVVNLPSFSINRTQVSFQVGLEF